MFRNVGVKAAVASLKILAAAAFLGQPLELPRMALSMSKAPSNEVGFSTLKCIKETTFDEILHDR